MPTPESSEPQLSHLALLREKNRGDSSYAPVQNKQEFEKVTRAYLKVIETSLNERNWLEILQTSGDRNVPGVVSLSNIANSVAHLYSRIGDGPWSCTLTELVDLLLKVSFSHLIQEMKRIFQVTDSAESVTVIEHELAKVSTNANMSCSKAFETIKDKSFELYRFVKASGEEVIKEMESEEDFDKVNKERVLKAKAKIIEFLEDVEDDPLLQVSLPEDLGGIKNKIDLLKEQFNIE